MKIGYARVSTAAQDSSIQVELLAKEGVDRDRVYIDHGIDGRQTRRPGLDNAIKSCPRRRRLLRDQTRPPLPVREGPSRDGGASAVDREL